MCFPCATRAAPYLCEKPSNLSFRAARLLLVAGKAFRWRFALEDPPQTPRARHFRVSGAHVFGTKMIMLKSGFGGAEFGLKKPKKGSLGNLVLHYTRATSARRLGGPIRTHRPAN